VTKDTVLTVAHCLAKFVTGTQTAVGCWYVHVLIFSLLETLAYIARNLDWVNPNWKEVFRTSFVTLF